MQNIQIGCFIGMKIQHKNAENMNEGKNNDKTNFVYTRDQRWW